MVIKCSDQQQVTDDQAEKKAAASAMPVHYHCHLYTRICREMWKRTVLEAAGISKRCGAGKLAVCSLAVRRVVAFTCSHAPDSGAHWEVASECTACCLPTSVPPSLVCAEKVEGKELQLMCPQ